MLRQHFFWRWLFVLTFVGPVSFSVAQEATESGAAETGITAPEAFDAGPDIGDVDVIDPGLPEPGTPEIDTPEIEAPAIGLTEEDAVDAATPEEDIADMDASETDTADAVDVETQDTELAEAEIAEEAPLAEAEPSETRSLNAQVEDLKQQVIELNRDLFILEEELLFPANTQVAVFVSMDVGEFFQLDAVKLKLDDEVVTNYLYTNKQVDALHRGGVQRLYIGNMKTGEHELVAVFTGRGPKGREYKRGATLMFDKSSEAKKIELKVVDSTATQQPEFMVKEW